MRFWHCQKQLISFIILKFVTPNFSHHHQHDTLCWKIFEVIRQRLNCLRQRNRDTKWDLHVACRRLRTDNNQAIIFLWVKNLKKKFKPAHMWGFKCDIFFILQWQQQQLGLKTKVSNFSTVFFPLMHKGEKFFDKHFFFFISRSPAGLQFFKLTRLKITQNFKRQANMLEIWDFQDVFIFKKDSSSRKVFISDIFTRSDMRN